MPTNEDKERMNAGEPEERDHLEAVKARLASAIGLADDHVEGLSHELQETKRYLHENKSDMDHAEKVSVRQSIEQGAYTGEAAVAKKNRLRKLLASPYFGRIDFREAGGPGSEPLYIGIHGFYDESRGANIINDWRAPVSSMFYDYELGPACFEAPSGSVSGEILLKRQFRIRNGKMEFMLENSLNIHDDILQKELSQPSDDRMKNIVATIQRDQNAIVRNETSQVLIIQGVAGSGKTSIALHRLAFLLYRFKETLASRDILIISPNKVYADYISNVLPELGEERIPEMGMEELAADALDRKYRFQTFFEQIASLLDKNDERLEARIRYKSSLEFLNWMGLYLAHLEDGIFAARDLKVRRYPIPAWFIAEKFKGAHHLPLLKRAAKVSKDIEDNLKIYCGYDLYARERSAIRTAVSGMYKTTNLKQLYKDFFAWLGKPELFKPAARSSLEYSDVFPLIYLKMRLEGVTGVSTVKHLLVDEMQDYTPVQYTVLSRLFKCRKTLLGDANQSVNPHSSSSAETIQMVFPDADVVRLCKSYRSTFEIVEFSRKILPNPDLVAIERHGERPEILRFRDRIDEIDGIRNLVAAFGNTGSASLGIICRTLQEAEALFELLKEEHPSAMLLSAQSDSFGQGIILTTAYMAKGLEFDQVIVPHVTRKNYKSAMEQGILYVACTRAMHRLTLTHAGEPSPLIPRE